MTEQIVPNTSDAIHVVCFSAKSPFVQNISRFSEISRVLARFGRWSNVRLLMISQGQRSHSILDDGNENDTIWKNTVHSSEDIAKKIVDFKDTLGTIAIISTSQRAKGHFNTEWAITASFQEDQSRPDTHGSRLAPYEGLCCTIMRCTSTFMSAGARLRSDMCGEILANAVDLMNPYFAFITCEDLHDTQNGDFYEHGVAEPCTNIRREAMSYWALLPQHERRRRVPAIFWGNYYSGELLKAVQEKCPDFFDKIGNWKITEPEGLGPRPSPHIVHNIGPGVFWTLSEDPLHDSRSEIGSGTCCGGRFLALNLFARRLLSDAGIHI